MYISPLSFVRLIYKFLGDFPSLVVSHLQFLNLGLCFSSPTLFLLSPWSISTFSLLKFQHPFRWTNLKSIKKKPSILTLSLISFDLPTFIYCWLDEQQQKSSFVLPPKQLASLSFVLLISRVGLRHQSTVAPFSRIQLQGHVSGPRGVLI